MYVILTSKPGQYHTRMGDGLRAVEAWDYLLCGRTRSRFVIAEITGAPRIVIVEDQPPHVVNSVPAKFLQHFDSIEAARANLEDLSRGGSEFRLERVALAA